MARFVGIEQYAIKKHLYYYHVSTQDLGVVNFFIEIDSINNRVNIYTDRECSLFACRIDFNKPDEIIDCSNKGINDHAIHSVIVKTYKALQKNEFPDDISYCASDFKFYNPKLAYMKSLQIIMIRFCLSLIALLSCSMLPAMQPPLFFHFRAQDFESTQPEHTHNFVMEVSAASDESPVAHIAFGFDEPDTPATIHSLFVKPHYQKKGIGSSLFLDCVALLKKNKIKRIEWLADGSVSFYKKFGAEIFNHPDYPHDYMPQLNSAWMRYNLHN